jgi:hypothetical protein
MSQNRLPPPESEACLFQLRSSTQKGGTLIAEDVTDHATHERRICDPDGYRLPFCPRCGKGPLHVHDYRERVLRAELRKPVTPIVRLICVSCEAIWQILPLFIARQCGGPGMSCETRCGQITRHPPPASRNIGRRCRREPCGAGAHGGCGQLSH